MMLGSRDAFEYSECEACGAVQRVRVEVDLTPYYPSSYYAFAESRRGLIGSVGRRLRNWLALSPGSPFRSVANWVFPHPAADWLRATSPVQTARILDVGCGKGVLLRQFADAGFTTLTGVDPFLPETRETPPAVQMLRARLEDVQGEFDLIMFHHSLEHIVDQGSAVAAAARLLAPDGWCLVRIPTVSSYAWDHYREHWYQLDAPRHVVLHSLQSIEALGASAGLMLDHIDFDSTAWQTLWSDRYRNDIAMSEILPFSETERGDASALASRLNGERRGDQICVYFRKTATGS